MRNDGASTSPARTLNSLVQNLNGKVALITGAGSGIGKAAALLMAERGAVVGLVGRTRDELDEVASEIGTNAVVLMADISIEAEIEAAYRELISPLGGLDIVFANAGINGVWAPLEELTLEEWNETIGINLTGTFLTIKHAIPHLKVKGGSVIITSSINGTRTFSGTGATAYSCSKAGQVAMAKMLSLELGQWKIRVNVICPGAIETEIGDNTAKRNTEKIEIPVEHPAGEIPLTGGTPGTAKQAAQLVAFLASDEASHISGSEVWIDGAQSLMGG